MERIIATIKQGHIVGEQVQIELIRKSLHLLISIVPLLAVMNKELTMLLLASGTLFYAYAEQLRLLGSPVFIISSLTVSASRYRDRGRFVLGPVTLGIGAMLALLLYPAPAAAIAIYALAFGDSAASLMGKLIGGLRIPLTSGKTAAGSLSCFLVVLWVTFRVTGSAEISFIIAITATLLEVLPSGDLDNLLLPVGTGMVATYILLL
ncbi:MAG TPA: phosphatidate cytidylyltransferase [Spirochaetales bacterium]|nr:phosphatidate cytidylyltransferase [Spirochaetales bacterium]